MEILSYIIGIIIIFAAVIAGMFLGLIAKEELKPGKKYILLLHYILLAIILVLSVYFFESNMLSIFFAAMVLYLFIFKFSFNDIIIYCVFGIIYFLSFNTNSIIPLASLMLLYGFPVGSLLVEANPKAKLPFLIKKIIIRYIWIIPIAIILFLVI